MTHSTLAEYFVRENGRYKSIGVARPDTMPEGLYFHQKQPTGSRTTSVLHWVGTNPEQPLDINRLLGLMKQDEKLMKYLAAIQRNDSPEYKKLEVDCGYVVEPPRIYNISMHDLAVAILRYLFEQEKNDDRTSERNTL